MTILERLFLLQDKEYAVFQAKLTPSVSPEKFIGVRVPVLRNFAKELIKEKNYSDFLKELPHEYYDENMLHALLLSMEKDYETCVEKVEKFLPYVDNWAVCDIMSPKIFAKSDKIIDKIKEWSSSEHTYTSRFGIEMLMSFYLDKKFKKEYLEIPTAVSLSDYYSKMMVAWFFATALAKQWEDTIPYIEKGVLEKWTHNKAIQKAKESYRISEEQKKYLETLKKK